MPQPVVHFEITGRDGEKLRAYYSELFDWQVQDVGQGYAIVPREGHTNPDGVGIGGGIATGPEGYEGHVTFYVEVPDVEEALAALGAEDSSLRARLLARLADSLHVAADEERRSAVASEAVAIARRRLAAEPGAAG